MLASVSGIVVSQIVLPSVALNFNIQRRITVVECWVTPTTMRWFLSGVGAAASNVSVFSMIGKGQFSKKMDQKDNENDRSHGNCDRSHVTVNASLC